MSLKKNAISGIKWSAFSRFSKQFLQFITLIILARLLHPEDFGLMTTAMVIIGFLNIFRDMGISAAIIQKKVISEELLSSLFWVNVALGLIITIVLILIARIIAIFYNYLDLIPILQVLALSFVISSVSIIQQALLEKDLKFNLLARYEVISTLLGSSTGIYLAFSGYGVWSLVIQTLVIITTLSIMLWVGKSVKPRLIFNWREVKSVTNFSVNLAGFNVVNYFVRNTDYVLIQKFLGEKLLGYYNLAYRIMLYPLENITSVVTRVMFPVYSQVKEDNEQFRKMYIDLANAIALITFPLMLWITAVSDVFVRVLLGQKWEAVIPLLVILAPIGMIQSVYTPAGAIYQAKGRTDWWFRWGLFTGIIFISAFIIGLKWGIIGIAFGYLIANLITIYPGLAIPFSLINLKVKNFALSFSRTFLISVVMFLIVLFTKLFLLRFCSNLTTLILTLVTGIIVYFVLSYFINKEKIKYFYQTIKNP